MKPLNDISKQSMESLLGAFIVGNVNFAVMQIVGFKLHEDCYPQQSPDVRLLRMNAKSKKSKEEQDWVYKNPFLSPFCQLSYKDLTLCKNKDELISYYKEHCKEIKVSLGDFLGDATGTLGITEDVSQESTVDMTSAEIRSVFQNTPFDKILLNQGITEIYSRQNPVGLYLGLSYESGLGDDESQMGYVVNLFLKDEYINIDGFFSQSQLENDPSVHCEIASHWNDCVSLIRNSLQTAV